MTTSMLALNAILMISVITGIVTLLAWAIRTQQRDRTTQASTSLRTVRPAAGRPRSVSQPQRRPVAGRA